MLDKFAETVREHNPGLVIYETTHHESLPAMLDLSSLYFTRVSVYITQNSYDNLTASTAVKKWPNISFIVQQADVSNRKFIQKLFSFARKNKFTHLHISTLDHNLLYFAIQCRLHPQLEISLSVQAINAYRNFTYNSFFNVSEALAKHYLHRRIKHLRVFAPAMLSASYSAFPLATTVYIPSRFFSDASATDYRRREVFKIVIPGTVDARRRDYGFVLDTMKRTIAKTQNGEVELVILGNSSGDYGLSVIEAFTSALSQHLTFRYYQNYLSQQEYESQLGTADLIWGPVRVKTSFENIEETYGQSTATGLTGDLLLNTIPAIVPSDFVVPEWYDHAILHYSSSEECARIIVNLMRHPDQMVSIREEIGRDFSHITKGDFADAFKKMMGL